MVDLLGIAKGAVLLLGAVVVTLAAIVAVGAPLTAAWMFAGLAAEGWVRLLTAIGLIILAVVRL